VTNIACRSAFTIAFRRCLRLAALPSIATAGVAMAGAAWFAPALLEPGSAAGAMTSWLGLPLLVIAAITACTVIVLWPTFTVRHGNDDRGTDWIMRLQRGPLRGCGAVVCGALAAQLVLTLPVTTWLARELGAPATAVQHHQLVAPAQPLLAPDRPRIEFELPGSLTIAALELRPLAGMPGGALRASRLLVRGDGDVLTNEEVAFHQSGQMARITFAPRPMQRVTIELVEGNVPLFFHTGTVTAVEAEPRSGFLNGCIAATIYLLPTFLALAFACLCGSVAAVPTVLTVAMVLLFLWTAAGVGPGGPALLGLLRGHWLPGTGIFTASASSLAAGCAAMIGAMLLRRRFGT